MSNPYLFVRDSFPRYGNFFKRAAVDAVLTLMADSYPGDLDPSDRQFDYVVRHVAERLGDRHPITDAFFRWLTEATP